jgi:SAM-dependent methyltransferase
MQGGDVYDRLPYTDHAYAESHPDRLCGVARLSGWVAPDVTRARVLELGCGRGGNLLPMAAALPSGTFVGIDRSGRQIDEARRIAAESGVRNVRFEQADIEKFAPAGPAYDYVVAHGVCSWVSPPVRRALLGVIARALAPGGVAYVSFNVLPGWYERAAARDWLRFSPPPAGEAAAAVRWLRDQASLELASYRAQLARVAERLDQTSAAYAAHEYLAEEHHPQHIADFLAEASAVGLRYLGDAVAENTAFELVPEAVAERARSLDLPRAQQMVDFVRNTAFRRTLLVRADEAGARGWRWPSRLDATALESMRVASRLRAVADSAPSEQETFTDGELRVQVADAGARRALRDLAACAPRSMPFDDLARAHDPASRASLRDELFDLWLATGAIDLHTFEPALAGAGDERPRACPVARWHALHGGTLTNRWHQEVRLPDRALVVLLGSLDGTRDAAGLRQALRDAFGPAQVTDVELDGVVRVGLERLASAALLVP